MGVPLVANRPWPVHSLRPGTSFRGNTQRWQQVSTKNLRLLTLSVLNRSSIFGGRQAGSEIWAMHAVMRSGATSAIRSARCDAASRLPSAWPARMVWMWGGSLLDHMLLRKSSCTSDARLFKCRSNRNGLRSPSRHASGATGLVDRGAQARFDSGIGFDSRGFMMMTSTSVTCRYSSWDIT
jgi:hypothetical protein